MCGITGFIDKKIKEKEEVIRKMADLIKHRGPDSDGYYVDDDVALGFRRLSIIDLSTGSQPIYNEDKTKVITFNGEIYNTLVGWSLLSRISENIGIKAASVLPEAVGARIKAFFPFKFSIIGLPK